MSLDLVRKNLTSSNAVELKAALIILRTEGGLSDISAILPLVKHNDKIVSSAAISAACNIIKEKLVENFDSLPKETRNKLAILMESLDPSIIKEISSDLFHEDQTRRVRAVQVLGLLRKHPQLKPLLAKLVTDRDEKIRATAATLLYKFTSPDDQDTVIALLNDRDMRVRANTVETLENTGNARMIPVLKRFRRVESNRMRGNVLKALYNLGFKEIEQDLLEMMGAKDDFMTASALWVISQTKIATKSIIDRSAYHLTSTNPMVIDNAQKALRAVPHPRSKGFLKYLDFS